MDTAYFQQGQGNSWVVIGPGGFIADDVNNGRTARCAVFLEDTLVSNIVVDSMTNDAALVGRTLLAGTTLFGKIDTLEIGSGAMIVYAS